MGVNDCIDCNKKNAEVECNCIPVENADGTLQDIVLGCTDPEATNYNALANCDDGSCIDKVKGCMDPSSLNYSSCFNADCAGNLPGSAAYIAAGTYGDTSCCCTTAGCMDSSASNYDSEACVDDGSCIYPGCTDNAACNYSPQATSDDGSCTYPPTASVSATACDSYTWALDGQTYYTSGTYTHSDGAACPTTTTLNLTINNATSGTNTQSTCNSYTWAGPLGDGTTYTQSGTYTNTSTNALGCTHTETLNLTIQPDGCTDPTALNYNSSAICDDGSCIAPVGGCTYGPTGSLPSWNSIINDGGPNTNQTWAALYGISDPAAQANNYDANANVDNGTCNFHVYGCTDPLACNYDASATMDDGSCVLPSSQDLGSSSYGQETPNCLRPEGDGARDNDCSSSFQYPWATYGIAAYPYEAGEPAYGAHCTMHSGHQLHLNAYGTGNGSNNDDRAYSETYFFMATNLTIGSTICITWAEIVLALRYTAQCSDCLTGGWWIKMDTGPASTPSWSDINSATSLYDPVAGTVSHGTSPGGLSSVSSNYHNSEGETNDPGNSNGKNTAGAPNGSYSEWNEKCITFQATATTHRIHVVAVTDFDVCTTCHEGVANNNRHGAYVGISKVQISSDGCTGNCSC